MNRYYVMKIGSFYFAKHQEKDYDRIRNGLYLIADLREARVFSDDDEYEMNRIKRIVKEAEKVELKIVE